MDFDLLLIPSRRLLPDFNYCSRGPTPARERYGRADAASALAAGAPFVLFPLILPSSRSMTKAAEDSC